MKTLTKNTGKRLHKFVVLVVAGMISVTLYSQKSITSYELQKFTTSLFSSTEQIMKAFAGNTSADLFFEEEIEFEEWMMDLNKWIISIDTGSVTKKAAGPETGEVLDEEMHFEDWMFRTDWVKDIKTSAIDEEMEFEDWMMRPFDWVEMYTGQNPVSMN